jgi:chromosome segregation ATPase
VSDSLVLELLRAIRGDIAKLTERVGYIERSVADLHVQFAEHSVRMDRLGARLGRIKHRLDLMEAPSP